MLMDRLYLPNKEETIFHYCSAETLQAVATYGTLRFTDINMLNDEQEVRWAYSIFEEAATRLIKRLGVRDAEPEINISFIDSIDEIISPIQLFAHPFISCFSLKGDLLGQWRAYADDGKGFAIGFNADSLKNQLPATFLRVLYDKEEQVKEMMGAIVAIYLSSESSETNRKSRFFEDCVLLGTYMTAFKNPAFAEEAEIRAVHVVNVKHQGSLAKFVDSGGVVNSTDRVEATKVNFQVRNNHLVAYADIPFSPLNMSSPITELILGPKNHSAPGNLQLFFGGLGYEHLGLSKSEAPYR